jgi:hypothetical protein
VGQIFHLFLFFLLVAIFNPIKVKFRLRETLIFTWDKKILILFFYKQPKILGAL